MEITKQDRLNIYKNWKTLGLPDNFSYCAENGTTYRVFYYMDGNDYNREKFSVSTLVDDFSIDQAICQA